MTFSDSTLALITENVLLGAADLMLDNGTGGTDNKPVKIFFEKEAVHPISGDPNWFDYWQDNPIIQDLLNSVPKIKQFNLSTCSFEEQSGNNQIILSYASGYQYTEQYDPVGVTIGGLYGSHSSSPPLIEVGANTIWCQDSCYDKPTKVSHQAVDISVKLGPGVSKKKFAWNRNNVILEGIHVYYSTLVHEVEHAQIFYDNWKDGYDKSKDADDDEYLDDWETLANEEIDQSSFEPKPYGKFTNGLETFVQDGYHSYHPDDLFQDPPRVSAGTDYEEWRCLKKEYDLFSQLNEIDGHDWSYDPPVENGEDPRLRTQGKQW